MGLQNFHVGVTYAMLSGYIENLKITSISKKFTRKKLKKKRKENWEFGKSTIFNSFSF